MTFGSIDAEFSVGAQGLEVVACLEIFGGYKKGRDRPCLFSQALGGLAKDSA